MKKIGLMLLISMILILPNVIISSGNQSIIQFKQNSINEAPDNTDIGEIINEVNEETVNLYLTEFVQNYPNRKTGTNKCRAAGEYIYNEFLKFYPASMVKTDSWSMWGGKYHFGYYSDKNYYVVKSGISSNPENILFCVHHDSDLNTDGADDDGSGVAALLTIASILKEYHFKHNIILLSSSGEEQGLLGDYYRAKNYYKQGIIIKAALTADMIGYKKNISKVNLYKPQRCEWLAQIVLNVNSNYEDIIGLDNVYNAISYFGNSGHKAYEDYGFNCLKFWEAEENPSWPGSDPIENIDIPYLTKVTKLIIGTIATLANEDYPENDLSIKYPCEDRKYKNNEVTQVKLTKGDTKISGDITIKIYIKNPENVRKVRFRLFKGDNEKDNKKRDNDNNDIWPRPTILDINITKPPYEWTIDSDNYKDHYTVQVDLETTYGEIINDDIELDFVNIKSNNRLLLKFNLFLKRFPIFYNLINLFN